MTTGAVLSVTGSRIALFAKKSEGGFGESLVRLASGRRINQPSDGIPDYFFNEKMMRSSRSYSEVLRNIGEAMAFMDVAVSVGERVFNAIADMKEIVRQFYKAETTANDKEALKADFNALKNTVTSIIGSSSFDGMRLVGDNGGVPFKSIALETETGAQRIDIIFDAGDIADVSSTTLGTTDEATERSAIEAELEKAGSYLAKSSAFMRGLNAHYNLAASKMNTARTSAERSIASDAAEEMLSAMSHRIRTQASIAMLAQANIYQASVVKLLGW